MWLFGQFAATGSSAASYQQAEEPVSQLINDFGPPVASPAAARQRAAMPFVHLERDLLLAVIHGERGLGGRVIDRE